MNMRNCSVIYWLQIGLMLGARLTSHHALTETWTFEVCRTEAVTSSAFDHLN